MDLKAQKESFQGIWEKAGKPRTFEEIKALAESIAEGPSNTRYFPGLDPDDVQ